MWPKARSILKRSLFKDAAKVFNGNVLSRVAMFASSLILIKKMPPEQYGYFSIGLTISASIPQFTDFGLKETFVRLGSQYRLENYRKAHYLYRLLLYIRIATIGVLLVFGAILIPNLISENRDSQLLTVVNIGLIGGATLILWNYLLTILQSEMNFSLFATLNVVNSYLILALVLILAVSGKLNSLSILAVYIIVPFTLFLIYLKLIIEKITNYEHTEGILKKIRWFAFWLTVSTIAWIFHRQIDIYMLTYYRSPADVGIYSAALRLTSPLFVIAGSIATVYFPRVSTFATLRQFTLYHKRVLIISFFLCILALIAVMFSKIIFAFLGKDYLSGEKVFQILIFVPIFTVISNLLSYTLLAFDKPQVPALIDTGKAFFNFAGNFLLIPMYGIKGAAIATLSTAVMSAIIMVFVAQRYVNFRFKGADQFV